MTEAAGVPNSAEEANGSPADSPDSLVAMALRGAPSPAALFERIAAAGERARSAGAWPDPMVSFGLNGERYPGRLLGDDPMVMGTVMLSQVIPFPGKPNLNRKTAEAETDMARADLTSARRRLAAEIRSMYADLYTLDCMADALRQSLAYLDLLAPTVASRYAAGLSTQADLLEVQLRQSRLMDRLDGLASERAASVAAINVAMGRAANVPVRTAGLPAISVSTDSLAIANAPEVTVRRRALEIARWKLAAARRESWPNLAAGVEYGWRNGLPPMVTATLGLEIPVWKGRKQDAEVRAVAHELEMARQELRAAETEAGGEAARIRAAYDSAARQRDRYRAEIIPRSELLLDSRRAGYTAGTGSGFRDLIDAHQTLLDARAELAAREADLYKAGVELNSLAGTDPMVPREGEQR